MISSKIFGLIASLPPTPARSTPPLSPFARQLVNSWRCVADCSALTGQQQPGGPVSILFLSHLTETSQTADWSTGPSQQPDGSVERLVGCRGHLDLWKLLEVQSPVKAEECYSTENSLHSRGPLGMLRLRTVVCGDLFRTGNCRHYSHSGRTSGDFEEPGALWESLQGLELIHQIQTSYSEIFPQNHARTKQWKMNRIFYFLLLCR